MSLSSKDVTLVTTLLGESVYDETYVYGSADTIFTVSAGSEETTTEAISLIP
jgi:hypothetical protein